MTSEMNTSSKDEEKNSSPLVALPTKDGRDLKDNSDKIEEKKGQTIDQVDKKDKGKDAEIDIAVEVVDQKDKGKKKTNVGEKKKYDKENKTRKDKKQKQSGKNGSRSSSSSSRSSSSSEDEDKEKKSNSQTKSDVNFQTGSDIKEQTGSDDKDRKRSITMAPDASTERSSNLPRQTTFQEDDTYTDEMTRNISIKFSEGSQQRRGSTLKRVNTPYPSKTSPYREKLSRELSARGRGCDDSDSEHEDDDASFAARVKRRFRKLLRPFRRRLRRRGKTANDEEDEDEDEKEEDEDEDEGYDNGDAEDKEDDEEEDTVKVEGNKVT